MFDKIPKIRIPEWLPMRCLIAVECALAMTISYMLRFCIALTMIKMAKANVKKFDNSSCPILDNDAHEEDEEVHDFDWEEWKQGVILSSIFHGYLVFMIPAGILGDMYGAGPIISLGMLLSGLVSVLTPVSAYFHWILLCVLRSFMGIGQAMVFAPLHCIISHWIPRKERSTWTSVIFSGSHCGSFLNNILTGVLLGSAELHWVWIFYIYGVLGFIWFLLFCFTAYSFPHYCPHLSEKEKKVFEEGTVHHKPNRKLPLLAFITNRPIWALIIGTVGHDWGIFMLVSDIPKFIHAVLHYEISKNGILNSVLYLCIWATAVVSGILVDTVDKRKLVSTTWNRKIGTTIASVGPSCGLLLSVYTNCDRSLAIVALILGCGFMGFFYSSLKVSSIDIAPNFSGTIGAISQTLGSVAGSVVPVVVGQLTRNGTLSEWRVVMWITFVVMSICNIVYLIFASAEVQPFNSPEDAEMWAKRNKEKAAQKEMGKTGNVNGPSNSQTDAG